MEGQLQRLPIKSYSISLNAATEKTHDEVMGLGPSAFGRILDSIRYLIQSRDSGKWPERVTITMVVTQQNIDEVSEFIRMGNNLGVDAIWLRSLLPQPGPVSGLNYHVLSPTLHPNFEKLKGEALEAIASSKVPIQADPSSWSTPLFPPGLEKSFRTNPPEFISRDKALRDRSLRHRVSSLYTETGTSYRGTPRMDSGTILVWQDNHVVVKTPSQQWAYAVTLPIHSKLTGSEDGEVVVGCRLEEGMIRVSLVDSSNTRWAECFLPSKQGTDPPFRPSGEEEIRLPLKQPLPEGLQLVVDNVSETGTSSVKLTSIEVRSQESREKCNLRDLVGHNQQDPLDDGLNPLNRQPRFACKAVYYNLYVNEMFFRVNPCCYMQAIPGFTETRWTPDLNFMDVWNSPAMTTLRQRLRDGPLFGACRRCPENW